jgi:hypothetical protein
MQATGIRDCGHEKLISKGKKQTMIDLRGVTTNWFKTSFVPPQGFLGYNVIHFL